MKLHYRNTETKTNDANSTCTLQAHIIHNRLRAWWLIKLKFFLCDGGHRSVLSEFAQRLLHFWPPSKTWNGKITFRSYIWRNMNRNVVTWPRFKISQIEYQISHSVQRTNLCGWDEKCRFVGSVGPKSQSNHKWQRRSNYTISLWNVEEIREQRTQPYT